MARLLLLPGFCKSCPGLLSVPSPNLRPKILLINLLLPWVNIKPNQRRECFGANSNLQQAVDSWQREQEASGCSRIQWGLDLKDASLVLIAHCPLSDGTSPLAPAVQSLMLHPGVNMCLKNHSGDQIFFISAAATIRPFWPNFK